ncbi:MAG TPA: DUF4350 domain-containing protein [Gemmatimonadaceae bacterium]|nr:DUF4350 domain-containing protein [Gemmatimonadaceae bacterium]
MLERLLAPRVVFTVMAALILLTIVLTPPGEMGEREAHLTSYSVEPWGARGFHDAAARLGWPVERRLTPLRESLDTGAIYVVLAPMVDLTAREVNHLLEAVRGGAGLLFAPPLGSSPLADSLGITGTSYSFRGLETDPEPPRASPWAEHFADLYDGTARRAVRIRGPLHDDAQVFVQGRGAINDTTDAPVVVGLPFGDGHVAVVADPELMRNDFIRHDRYGVLPIRLLEWLAPGERPPVVFTEYHQGFGRQPSLWRAMRMLLVEMPEGRVLLQLLVALLLLVVAAGTRAIVPRPRRRVERRSPLEHVGALARAYEQVEATRLATRRLVHGLRRRRATGAARALGDESFLAAVAARHPHLAPDVERTLAALERRIPPSELLAVGHSIDHIDRTLAT